MQHLPPAPSSLHAWPSRWWAEVSARDFALAQAGLAAETVAVLPVAAVEQHGPHLPLSVDARLLQGVIDAALPLLPADLPVLFLPPQNIGFSVEHQSFAGTLTLAPATVIALWTELGACVARAGVRRLLLLNGHGGQVSVMDVVARELRMRHGLLVYSSSWFGLVDDAANAQFSAHEHRFGIHGGEVETSMMLHLAPGTVRMEHARDFHSTSEDRAQRQDGLSDRGLLRLRGGGECCGGYGRARGFDGGGFGSGAGAVVVRDGCAACGYCRKGARASLVWGLFWTLPGGCFSRPGVGPAADPLSCLAKKAGQRRRPGCPRPLRCTAGPPASWRLRGSP
jgi:creatinine amidohydrolase